ncbi:MAG TPA: hypothetical protein VNX22_02105 [Acidobacteriaceae bacterium]|nr:hypothetical protein [Acidobacteriaceae bacterium]
MSEYGGFSTKAEVAPEQIDIGSSEAVVERSHQGQDVAAKL